MIEYETICGNYSNISHTHIIHYLIFLFNFKFNFFFTNNHIFPFWLYSINLTQTQTVWEKGTSTEGKKMFLPDQSVGKTVGHVLHQQLMWEGLVCCAWYQAWVGSPGQQAGQTMRSNPVSSALPWTLSFLTPASQVEFLY